MKKKKTKLILCIFTALFYIYGFTQVDGCEAPPEFRQDCQFISKEFIIDYGYMESSHNIISGDTSIIRSPFWKSYVNLNIQNNYSVTSGDLDFDNSYTTMIQVYQTFIRSQWRNKDINGFLVTAMDYINPPSGYTNLLGITISFQDAPDLKKSCFVYATEINKISGIGGYVEFAISTVSAHELGHMCGISANSTDSDDLTCCIMNKTFPYANGCSIPSVNKFCKKHSCEVNSF